MTISTYSNKHKKFDTSSLTNDELAQAAEEYNKRLARAETSLREWIACRNAWAKKGGIKQQ